MMKACGDATVQADEAREIRQEPAGLVALDFPILYWMSSKVC